eukprot:75409-Hanusia_phi.AAC.1
MSVPESAHGVLSGLISVRRGAQPLGAARSPGSGPGNRGLQRDPLRRACCIAMAGTTVVRIVEDGEESDERRGREERRQRCREDRERRERRQREGREGRRQRREAREGGEGERR